MTLLFLAALGSIIPCETNHLLIFFVIRIEVGGPIKEAIYKPKTTSKQPRRPFLSGVVQGVDSQE